jgi:hypothetical protein
VRNIKPEFDDKTQLVIRFACETSEISTTFIAEEVFGKLRDVQFGTTQTEARKAFLKVEMLGEVKDIWREKNSYELVADGDEELDRRFVSFEGYAVVNLGRALPEEDGGGGRSARASRSRAR